MPKPQLRGSLAVSAAVSLALFASYVQSQELLIVPDGRTTTQVNGEPTGRLLVLPAEANASGVSMNGYERFDVGPRGADFDNNGVRARVLVNEVTGSLPSRLQGEIAVLGPRAHFVLANPNGLLIDGARFVNTGGVALSTGTVELATFNPTPHASQTNVLLHTSQGAIEIGEGGLGGAMTHLELISRELRINGPVGNEYSNEHASLRLITGASTVDLDSSVSPVDERTAWLRLVAGDETTEGILVDITPLGSLRAGRIEVLVTNAGAGVRHAGEAYAMVGDFTLASGGALAMEGGTIWAAGHAVIASGALRSTASDEGRAASIEAERGQLLIRTPGEVSATGTALRGGAGADVQAESLRLASVVGSDGEVRAASLNSNGGSVAIATSGAVALEGADVVAMGGAAIAAGGDMSLSSVAGRSSRVVAYEGALQADAGGWLLNEGGLLQGKTANDEAEEGAAVSLHATAGIVNRSVGADGLAIVFGQEGDVALRTEGDLVNDTGRIIANGSLAIDAAGDVANVTGKVAGANGEQPVSSGGTSRFLGVVAYGSSSYRQDFGALAIPGQIAYLIADGDLDVRARNVLFIGGSLAANDGDIRVVASERIENRALRTGKVSYKRSCFISCRPEAKSSVAIVGGTMSATGSVSLDAGTEVLNVGGALTAVESIDVAAPLTRAEAIEGLLAISQSRGLAGLAGQGYARLLRSDSGGQLVARGDIRIEGDLIVDGGEILADGEVTVSGVRSDVRAPVKEPVPTGIPDGGVFSSVLD